MRGASLSARALAPCALQFQIERVLGLKRETKPGRTSAFARIGAWLVAAVVVGGLGGVAVRRGLVIPALPFDEDDRAAPIVADEPLIDDDVTSEAAEPRFTRPAADATATFHGFCPVDGPEVTRPNLATLVNDRVDELVDRARTARSGASDELQQGLVALYGRNRTNRSPEEAMRALRQAPDRRRDGFDYVAAAALTLGVRALRDRRWEAVLRWSRESSRADRDDAAPWVLEALAGRRMGDDRGAKVALWNAFERAPDEPAIGLAVGRAYADTASTDRALRGLDTYLAEYPEDATIAGLRARLQIRAELQVDFQRRERDGVTLLWASSVSDDLAESAHDAVLDALRRASALLGTPRREELTVWVYGARADVLAVTCVQGWARAVFDGALHLDGEGLSNPRRMNRHIDHETLHGQLAAVAPGAPVWLHEGLAQRFAEQRSRQCLQSWEFMVRNETWIPFASLEGTFQVISDADDAGMAYHQSLGMVEMLLARGGSPMIREAVDYFRRGGLSVHSDDLLDHLGGRRPFTGRELLEVLETRLEEVADEAGTL